jgi:hypothetical protein
MVEGYTRKVANGKRGKRDNVIETCFIQVRIKTRGSYRGSRRRDGNVSTIIYCFYITTFAVEYVLFCFT